MEEETVKLPKLSSASSVRGEVRAPLRTENSRDLAKIRADEIRKHRAGTEVDGMDRYYIDPNIIPDGWSYEWKRKSVHGLEDPAYQVNLASGGWTAVPVDRDARHRALMPQGNYATIERDGMMLMERPLELTEEARDVELRRARGQVRAKEQQLASTPDGTMTREHERVRPSIKKGYEPMAVPKD